MKCRVCGRQADINLKAYNTALCRDDFISFLEKRVRNTIERYHLIEKDDIPIVAVSGGKDSLSLWYLLNRIGLPADGVYVDLGIEGYSSLSLEKIKGMANLLGRRVYVFDFLDLFGRGIDAISKTMKRTPCSACGMVKRYLMNRVCMDKGYDVLITGHNLDDEAAALLGNIIYWKKEYLWKKDVLLERREGHLSRKAKPLFLCSEREMAAYALLNNIDYIYAECPFSHDAKSLIYKGILNRLEEASPGTKLQFVKGYLKILKGLKQEDRAKKEEIIDGHCPLCGYPSYGGRCTFCRILERLNIEGQVAFYEYQPVDLKGCDGRVE